MMYPYVWLDATFPKVRACCHDLSTFVDLTLAFNAFPVGRRTNSKPSTNSQVGFCPTKRASYLRVLIRI